MDEERLVTALCGIVDKKLAQELAADFLSIRRDFATKTLGRASPGKFVETLVQCLQFIDKGVYEAKPSVDAYLSNKGEQSKLPDGLRICAARIARSVYTLRNKRNIAHKNEIDPNSFDLAYIHAGAAWIMAELIRNASRITMEEAGQLIELIQAPVGTLIEDIDGVRLVHADTGVRVELLILLHSHYPDVVPMKDILASLSRRDAKSVNTRLRELHSKKLVHGSANTGYRLTVTGHAVAVAEIEKLSS